MLFRSKAESDGGRIRSEFEVTVAGIPELRIVDDRTDVLIRGLPAREILAVREDDRARGVPVAVRARDELLRPVPLHERRGRVPPDDVLFEQEIGGGFSLELLASYLFDRTLFQGTSFSSGRTDVVAFEPGLGLSAQLLWRR